MGNKNDKNKKKDKCKHWYKKISPWSECSVVGKFLKGSAGLVKDLESVAEQTVYLTRELVKEIPILLKESIELIHLIPRLVNILISLLEHALSAVEYVFDEKNKYKILTLASLIFLVWAMKSNSFLIVIGELIKKKM